MNLDKVNGYVLVGISFLAICLYLAVVATGMVELMSKKSGFGARKRSRNQRATRGCRKAKGSPNS